MSGSKAGDPAVILVVDDNELNRDLLSRRLERAGHRVRVAEHGRRALEMVAAEPFDLVLLDIMMPEMNGYEVLEHLKADERHRHIPVIMITAVEEQESIVRCLRLGAEDHLPKPFNPDILHARVSSSLARKRLHDREQLYAESMERELEIGRRIQQSFLPEAMPTAAGWEIASCFEPARQVAGDFYDAFALPTGELALVVGDICDKGVAAALFMAVSRTLLRAVAAERFRDASADGDPLLATVTTVNDYLARTHGSSNMFGTMFIAVLQPVSGRLRYINAGHEAPIVVDAGGDMRTRLEASGPAVGMMPELPFGIGEAQLAPGELLLAYTDGVTDTRAPDGTEFGEARMLALVNGPSANAVLTAIEQARLLFAAGEPAFDDVTMLGLRRSP